MFFILPKYIIMISYDFGHGYHIIIYRIYYGLLGAAGWLTWPTRLLATLPVKELYTLKHCFRNAQGVVQFTD